MKFECNVEPHRFLVCKIDLNNQTCWHVRETQKRFRNIHPTEKSLTLIVRIFPLGHGLSRLSVV